MALRTQNATLKISAGDLKQFPRDRIPQVAMSGRSNVGKSSLINTLLGRKNLAHVGQTPGKTITVNFYDVDHKLYLVDLPGYGYARRSAQEQQKWSALTETYITGSDPGPSLILQLIDLKAGPTKDDYAMLNWLADCGVPYIVVATKLDRLNKTEGKANLEALKAHPYLNPPYAKEEIRVIGFSSQTGQGKDELLSAIEHFL